MGREPGIPDQAARDLQDAIRHLEQAVRLSPDNARYSGLLGEAWLLQGDPEAALAPLQNSLHKETHPRIASLMALALLRLDRHADAARIATVALEETSAFHRAHFIRSEARMGTGDVAGAIDDLRHAVSLAPTSEPYRLRLASHLVERARNDAEHGALIEAREILDGIAHPREAQVWRYLRGCVLVELGEPHAALLALEDVTWPTLTDVALRRGYAYIDLGRRDDALLALQQARVDPALTDEADRLIARLESGPDPDAPTARAAPKTELVTSIAINATELLPPIDDTEESVAELELLQRPDPDDPDSSRHFTKSPDDGADDGP